jgi:curved DNA-binding protein CbpA
MQNRKTASFVDYYEILQLSPNADQETIERVHRLLAKKYHPDNLTGGDLEKFMGITEAFRVLSDPIKRADYDASYEAQRTERMQYFYGQSDSDDSEEDGTIQRGILSILLSARKRDPLDPGVGPYELEKYLRTPQKHLEFHVWYLKEKGWITRTENGQWTITANGVDEALKNGHYSHMKRLLTSGRKDENEHDAK